MKYQVVEKFVSINGEGTRAGKIAAFIRFKGCNLNCSFCDTKWANKEGADFKEETAEEIAEYIKKQGVHYVTLTGGEPLLREGIPELLNQLIRIKDLYIEFETNGSMDLSQIAQYRQINGGSIHFTMDYKLPFSRMEEFMKVENFSLLTGEDTVKFVIGSKEDLQRAKEVIQEFGLEERCEIYFSPVFGEIEARELVEFMIENGLHGVTMQLQMHKFIWDPDAKGV